MSGHSKWSQIKRKKGIKDQQKGAIFTKISKLISHAVSESGITDPNNNIKLRMAIAQAKGANMPKENIKRAIEKGTGPDKENILDITYEGFGPAGVVFMIYTTTDNQNRTHAEIKQKLERNNCKIGAQGSVSYMFKKCGLIILNKDKEKEEEVFKFADQINAFDIDEDGESYFIYFPFENLGKISNETDTISEINPELDYKPMAYVKINKADIAKKILKLITELEDIEDVHKVFSNFDIQEDVMKDLEV
ncbi:MAG: YebC/PmpR family DNA-binding transcriptional regulator [bacterium]